MKRNLKYNFKLISLAFILLMSSNGISFYTHLCSISNKVIFSLNAADPCEEENKKDCCSHKSEQNLKEKCCKINFIFFKIKENIQQQRDKKSIDFNKIIVFFDNNAFENTPIFSFKNYSKFGYNPPPNLPLKSRIILYQSFLC
ncbi:MAG: hypothetical protein IPI52_09350 [Bacteroidetes bacterium]|nr:hypothetical protein [Bacteroidota bacterium]